MAKDKKKKKKDKSGRVAKRLEALSNNRLVADVVAAALVATASALKDSRKAKALAASAGDELEQLAKEGAERGNAMWKLALEVGRRALDTIVGEEAEAPKAPKAPKAPRAPKAPKASKAPRSAKASPKAK
jgi:putative endonuclease